MTTTDLIYEALRKFRIELLREITIIVRTEVKSALREQKYKV